MSEAPIEPITTPAPEPKEEQLSPKFAALARQQKMIRKQQMEVKAREDAFKAKETDYETNYIPKSKLKENPYETLMNEGVEFESLLAQASQDPSSAALKRLQARMDAIEAQKVKEQETAQETSKKQYDQAIASLTNEAKMLVSSDESFEALKGEGEDGVAAIVKLIETTFREEQRVMTVQDAATEIEEALLSHAVRMASLNKVKQRLAPKEETPVAPAAKTPAKTLTNANTTAPTKTLTDKERRERAIAAFRGQL